MIFIANGIAKSLLPEYCVLNSGAWGVNLNSDGDEGIGSGPPLVNLG